MTRSRTIFSRRELLAAALLPRALGGANPSKLLVQTYVFTQEFGRRKIALRDGVGEMFETVRDAGFDAVELMPPFLAPDLRDHTIGAAKKFGVRIPIVYTGGAMHTVEAVMRTMRNVVALAKFATTAVNINPDPIGRAKTDAELAIQADGLNRLGLALAGMKRSLFVHHHTPEMADNAREWRSILDGTDPEYVRLCVDTHWAYRSGQDWMRIVRDAGPRLASVHVRNSVQGVWAESFGAGDLDYRELASYLRRARLTPFIVVELAYEEKTPRTRPLLDDLKRSYEYARRLFV